MLTDNSSIWQKTGRALSLATNVAQSIGDGYLELMRLDILLPERGIKKLELFENHEHYPNYTLP